MQLARIAKSQKSMIVFVGAGVASAALLGSGCAADQERHSLTATLPVASSVGTAKLLAKVMQQEADTQTSVPEAARAELRARAQVLGAHATSLGEAIDRYDETGKRNPSITLANLQARSAALETERLTAMREWQIWQVQYGLKKPADQMEVFDLSKAGL